MIGDIILALRQFIKQHITCRHEYELRHAGIEYSWWECNKCGRKRKFLDLFM